MTAAAWEAALDAFEHDLDQFGAVIDDGGRHEAPPAFVPPADLGPVPPELLPRVAALGAAYEATAERALVVQAQVRAELDRLPRARVDQRPNRLRTMVNFVS